MIFNILSDYFEYIMAVNVFLIIGMIVMIVFSRIRNVRVKHIRIFFHGIFYYFLLIAQLFLLVIMVVIFAINFQERRPLDFSARILATTDWVEEDVNVHFISGNELITIDADGKNRKIISQAPDRIRQYHFSPDGRSMVIVTNTHIFILDRQTQKSRLIDRVNLTIEEGKVTTRVVIAGVEWDPAGKKFCYRKAMWSQFSFQEQWYVYDTVSREKLSIKSPFLKMTSLKWDQAGENLYHLWFRASDETVEGNPFELKIYKISLDQLKPELIAKFPYHKADIDEGSLSLRGIYLFTVSDRYAFGRAGPRKTSWVSQSGSRIGIDEFDYLYYIKNLWWRKRLYRVPRTVRSSDIPRHQYRGGELVIQHLRWLPGDRYVIMEHYYFGILILDPASGKIGILDNQRGNTFGWYHTS